MSKKQSKSDDASVSKEEATKLNKELAKTRQKPKTTEEILKKELTTEEKKEANNQLKNPSLLNNILKELNKDHIGDQKQKLFLFCDCLSSRLKPQYRFSSAITGDTSEGKTNIWKTISRHLPKEWYLDLTRITASEIEDSITDFNLVYFGEKSANSSIIEQVKQLVEDGLDVMKKDKNEKGQWISTRRQQPRKVGIYTTTGNIDDEELSSRYCVVSVHGNQKKYALVNQNTLETASNIHKEIEKHNRTSKKTWIEQILRLLKPFDIITIPYAPLFEVESRQGRSQRDLKRFLNLIRSLTWLHQNQRIQFEHEGFTILVAAPEDFHNAMILGKEILDQSLSGIEPRLQEVIDSYKKLKQEQFNVTLFEHDDEVETLEWVDRSLIQKDLDIKTRDTIHKRVKKLSEMNIFTYLNRGPRSYIAFKENDLPSNLPSNNPLITGDTKQIYNVIKTNYQRFLETQFDGNSSVFTGGLDGKTELLLLKNELPSKNNENKLFDNLKKQIYAKNDEIRRYDSTVDKKKDNENSSLSEKHKKAQDIITEFPEENYGYIDFECGSDYIKKCLKLGILTKINENTLSWSGGNK